MPAQPGEELAGYVLACASEFDHRPDVILPVARVEAAAAEQDAVHPPAVGAARRQLPERVAELELASVPGRGVAQDLKDRRIADAPADHDPVGGGVGRGRL